MVCTINRFMAGAILLASLAGCVGPAREPLDNVSELKSDETIVVGKISLAPALKKSEQKLQGINSSSFENKIYMISDAQYRELKDEPGVEDFTGRIEATLENNFFVRSQNKSFYIIGGMMYLKLGGAEISKAYVPGGLKAGIKPGDKAVYIGTVQYHRDEFFNISKVAIIDDYDHANAEFKKKFGTKMTLRKALLTLAK